MITGGTKTRSAAALGRLRSHLTSFLDIFGDAIRNYQINGDTNQAAAIALYGILSIIPLFILTLLAVGSAFSANPDIEQKLIEGIRQFIPSFTGALLFQFSHIEGKREVLGSVGIITLVWFSSMIFNAIETALDIIFRSKNHRNYLVSKLLAIAMIPLGWAVGVVSVGITYIATILAAQPLLGEGGILYFPAIQGVLFRYVIPYLFTVLFFTIVYKAIPMAKVGMKSALIGSVIFSALMEIAKQFFTWYIANYTRYNVIFGSLEAVVILVIYFFYISLIFLFCAELISAYQRRDSILIEKALLKREKGSARIDERLVRKFGRLYDRDEYIFHEGEIGQALYYILSGRVRMEKKAGRVMKVLAERGPGEYFGETAALIQAPHTASARSLETSHIAVIGGDMLRGVLRESDEASLFILREFSKRLMDADISMKELTQAWIKLTTILYFLRKWPLSEDRNPAEELMKATDKEAVEIQEALAELARRGIITATDGRVIAFHREEALRLLDEQLTV
jgi:membrane protein